MIKVKGHSNYRRDLNNNSIVNTDMTSYNEYKMRLKRVEDQEKRISNIEEKLDTIMEILLNKAERK